MVEPKQFWFPAKRHGWGWGPPITWQGWVVLAAFFLLLLAGAFLFLPTHNILAFLAYTVVICVVLVAICYAKGEPAALDIGTMTDAATRTAMPEASGG